MHVLNSSFPVTRTFAIFLTFAVIFWAVPRGWAEPIDAAKVFQQKCASCHGANGQGTADGYKKPLGGKYSLDELIELIDTTMPLKDPQQCVGEEARLVAEYVYHRFYARGERGSGANVELTRLTVEQHRNALADLFARFAPVESPPDPEPRRRRRERPPEPPPKPRLPIPPGPGLRAEYFQSKGMSKADNLVLERVDSYMAFDFGTQSPAKGIAADQFSIIWDGGLIANHTGYYEFQLSTQNGARLYFNLDPQRGLGKLRDDSSATGQKALIDVWVGSGQMREQSARVFLLGGRTYPLRLEFFKYMEKSASVALRWKRPTGVWEVLDDNHTTTVRPARVFVCETPFPADDRSLGYERGSSVSAEWLDASTRAAVATATECVERLPLLANFPQETGNREQPQSADREQQESANREKLVKDFVLKFAFAAFRRPLTDVETRALSKIPFSKATDLEAAAGRAVLMVLMSPNFLYSNLATTSNSNPAHARASRLSWALWDSIPDQELLDAADNGKLETLEQIEHQARRMLVDDRTKAKMRIFFQNWLELEERDIAKDKKLFPEFDEAVVADLRHSLELFVDQVVWSASSDYRQLLLADHLLLNERLLRLYQPNQSSGESNIEKSSTGELGVSEADIAKEDIRFHSVAFPAAQRSGVLTHPYLLSAFAYHNNTSPIHRGVFLTRNIVGRELNPPPMAIAFKDDEFAPNLTMREKITQLTRDTACMSCHSVINPLGFALENYDAVGRWRTTDKNKPVDTRSEYQTASGETLDVANARDVANYAVSSQSAHRAFVTQVFQHMLKQDPGNFGPELVDRLQSEFAKDNFHVQNLWVNIAATMAARDLIDTQTKNPERSP